MEGLASTRNRFLVLGIAALAVSALGAIASPEQFFRSYLLGWVFWASVALGCLPLVMLHHMTGGAWGLVIRRMLEAGGRTLPMIALLFVPILFGMRTLYLWARPEAVEADAILREKSIYLNVPFFAARTALYFAIWIGMGWLLARWSRQLDETADLQYSRRMQLFSGPATLLFGLTVTFAAIDWLMSLEPHWFSTIFGMWFLASVGLAGFSFVIVMLVWLAGRRPIADVIQPSMFHDLGKLLLAFVMVWAYLSFSQFLIIFSGNLPEEIPYYLDRSGGGWSLVAIAVVVLHFVLPFVLLLSRDLKRRGRLLAGVALLVLAMRYVDLVWLIVPAFGQGMHWMDVTLPLGLGGVWLAAFLWRLEQRPILPLHDPYAEEWFAHAAEH